MKLFLLLLIPMFCFAQEGEYVEKYTALKALPNAAFEKAVNDSIIKLRPDALLQFLRALRNEYDTKLAPFYENITTRLSAYDASLDIYNFSELLAKEKIQPAILENILTEKKYIWDKGEWAEKFWKLIRANKFKVAEGPYYSVNDKGKKHYDLKSLLKQKMETNEIGKNPMIEVDYKIISYPENRLLETLEKFNIKDITIISKDKSVGFYGSRGVNGFVKVLIRPLY